MRFICAFLLSLVLCMSTSCARNPVTGTREFSIISEKQEQNIGNSTYKTMVQAQGGPFTADAELTQYVAGIGKKIAKESGRPNLAYEFVIINDPTPNAWALPGGKIAIHRGMLVELSSEAELAAVLSHEIVHAAARHSAKGMERALLLQGGIVSLGLLLENKAYNDILIGSAQVGAMLMQQTYSRTQELEADHFGMHYMAKAGYDPQAAVCLQETFLRLSKEKKSLWLDGLFASHPPTIERICENQKTLKTLINTFAAKNQFVGKEEYQKKIASLKSQESAYSEYENAKKLLEHNGIEKARMYLNRALFQYPNEALFWKLKGDIFVKEQRLPQALEAYTQAIQKNPNYYLLYQARGAAYLAMQKNDAAKQDLEMSRKLLPTGDAHEMLGKIALDEGQKHVAKQHLALASNANSQSGMRARKLLESLTGNAHEVEIEAFVDTQNRLIINVINRSEKVLDRLDLVVEEFPVQGNTVQKKVRLRSPIKAFGQQRLTIQLQTKSRRAPEVRVA